MVDVESIPPEEPDIAGSSSGPRFAPQNLPQTLCDALFRARRDHGGRRIIAEDHDRDPLSYDQFIQRVLALSSSLERLTSRGERVGVLLPTSVGAAIVFFALQFAGCTAVMLNYSANESTILGGCDLCRVKTVLTSSRFLTEARLKPLASALERNCRVVELETLVGKITMLDKVRAFSGTKTPLRPQHRRRPEDEAVILFTSGTTGAPKAVVLSHANLIANVEQCRLHTMFDLDWVFFNTLPIFHAFGLTAGTLLPILTGLKVVLYPSPLHVDRIPALIEATQANLLISTDTFARNYARSAGPGALKSLKYAVLGAEKVREETRKAYSEFGGALVLEGYGTTECAPTISFNPPNANKPGTVGTLLPGIEARFVRVAGIEKGGKLEVRGPNVMKGYIRPCAPDLLDAPRQGWFDTGDIAAMDDDGYLKIIGRLKRFARVGAEMVSLTAIEERAQAVWPGARHAAFSAPGEARSEEIILVTDQKDAAREPMVNWMRSHGTRMLELPKQIVVVDNVPVLPTGKIDYQATEILLQSHLARRGQEKT